MSSDDKLYMASGFRVRHTYKKRGKGAGVCVRCGVKRRYRSSGWEYKRGSDVLWGINNPPCVRREPEQEVVSGDAVFTLSRADPSCRAGILLRLTPDEADGEHKRKLGDLWVWSRSIQEHYLMQTSHVQHVHRVHALFWSFVLATAIRDAICGCGDSRNAGQPLLAVYVQLREAGILPVPDWKKRRPE